ncbi:MAG TPA: histidinol-phosphate transaminase [Eubacteriaceae bacterium]|nr:histidinol-phosphate transaminase [Eubacteriaceae bacterium]
MYKYLREEIKCFKPYQVNDVEHSYKLDANEGIPWLEDLNLYPNDRCDDVREKLSKLLNKTSEELLIGNGSSELIDYVMKAYLEFDEVVVSISPSFAMYKIYTIINKGKYEDYPLENMEYLNVEGFIQFIKDKKAKLIFLSNPNNPTGSIIPKEDIRKIVSSVDGMVILDEAYIEFTDYPLEDWTREFKNLIVLRTFSKAIALAGIRLGYMIAHKEVIDYINRVRAPYNVNSLTQKMAIKALENLDTIYANIKSIKSERARVREQLDKMGYRTFPSWTNFIFFYGGEGLAKALLKKGVLIRDFGGDLEGYYRVTIGTPKENNGFLQSIQEVKNENS